MDVDIQVPAGIRAFLREFFLDEGGCITIEVAIPERRRVERVEELRQISDVNADGGLHTRLNLGAPAWAGMRTSAQSATNTRPCAPRPPAHEADRVIVCAQGGLREARGDSPARHAC